ncbi:MULTISPECIES: SufE family protein [unclassified Pseudomonas]|uniref:SufE family protein n=1 Tax=unclassified Pseudomonas TaxID=196821 RepID=UPI000BC9502A|nr:MULTISPECIES: SufE family protein [unclassified Pseudomonas]PVZ20773.1 cysteine desulfuration protein SufE [Pseudomonas sp. URIL14HWK12:I12]PVZ27839.1 cysteine desulfuration protein SufE [Pseudomonas sp. URIL14HWK12:I10]PVZ38728.1 cysteine desulfuration protein SufE [Pseudomonas sp. URIL14HWK12:I11]SNZ02239.1 cysteine desulfuration protein SufE [Pseudomonas sp. URIL14HWK12:I9]
MSLPIAAQAALDELSAIASWEQRARALMQWGERLAPLSEAEKTEANRVQGCESQVWLVAERKADGWAFRASSDARLLRGLLALLLVRVEGLSAQQLDALDAAQWFQALGLGRQLSPSRSNGLNAVVQRMKTLVSG